MTSEVALLNKTAVALAADSAMTLGGSGKTYPAQKLFALTKHHPVGVMIYNNAEFMGVPWETLIKMYRVELSSKRFATIDGYAGDFLSFISKPPFKTREQEATNVMQIAEGALAQVRDLADHAKGQGSLVTAEALAELVETRRSLYKNYGRSPSLKGVRIGRVVSQQRDALDQLIHDRFDGLPMTVPVTESLRALVGDALTSDIPGPAHSGLVIAGFGEKEVFPTLTEVTTDGIVAGKLKYSRRRQVNLARNGDSATIIPFAQHEMVTRFMEGIDPTFLDYLRNTIGSASTQLVREVLEALGVGYTEKQEQAIQQAATAQMNHYLEQAERFRSENFVAPIMEIVQHLPKEELADMAEALVNLTALKRRVSLDPETVGGPIDVAVVSKGDGLIWIKRKHYFDPALNRSYFTGRP